MFKKYLCLPALILFTALFIAACGGSEPETEIPEGSATLNTGYALDEHDQIVSPQDTFKVDEDFYFSFDNDEPFGNNSIKVELINTATEEVIAEMEHNPDAGLQVYAESVWIDAPGTFLLSVRVGGQLRANHTITIE